MKKSIKVAMLGVIASSTIASGVITSPANAVSPLVVTVSKTTELSVDGESVSISVSGIPTDQGVYVFQCASDSADPRPASATCRTTQGDSLWLSTSASSLMQGASNANVAQTLSLLRTFTISGNTFDCRVVSCGIFIRRDHLGSSDFSLDTLIPISFKADPKPVVATPVVTGPIVVNVPENAKIVTSQIKFGSGEKLLSRSNKKKLNADLLKYSSASKIVITGTASRTVGASDKTVKRLAMQRANAIKKYLVAKGVTAEKIIIKTKIAKQGEKLSVKVVASP